MAGGRLTPRHLARIVSGGQTGVDRAALDAAIAVGVPYGGWCPAGGWAEDLPHPPGLLRDYPRLRETSSAAPEERSRRNVRDSDLVLVVRPADLESPGTDLTVQVAAELGRPVLVTPGDVDEVVAWLAVRPRGLVLDVAGPRASEWAGAHATTLALLRGVLDRLGQGVGEGVGGTTRRSDPLGERGE